MPRTSGFATARSPRLVIWPARRYAVSMHTVIVAPGFIDMLGQSELTILVNPQLPSKIFQGITTEITGEGGSIAPLNDPIIAADHVAVQLQGQSRLAHTDQYFARLERQGIGINLASYVGATQVRRIVLGDADKKPNEAELNGMKALVRAAMEEGAVGLSPRLARHAGTTTTEELIALASEASKYGGIYATHMRSEGARVLEAIEGAHHARRRFLRRSTAAGKPRLPGRSTRPTRPSTCRRSTSGDPVRPTRSSTSVAALGATRSRGNHRAVRKSRSTPRSSDRWDLRIATEGRGVPPILRPSTGRRSKC